MSVAMNEPLQSLRRRVRLLMLLDGAECAGIAPMRLRHLHTYAYLVNVLAPVWATSSLDGSLLKRLDGPFYPALQGDLDRLIGLGLVDISDLGHVLDEDARWRLDGRVALNLPLAGRTLDVVRTFPEERDVEVYIREIGFAVASLTAFELEKLSEQDPTYSDEMIAYGNIVDFDEWKDVNYSANAAKQFSSLYATSTPGELLHMYVRHLRRRLSAER